MKYVTAAFAAAACLNSHSAAFADTGKAPDWVYGDGEMPEQWSIANESYAACDAGAMQSPIDLAHTNASGDVALATSYGMAQGELVLGPAKVQVDVGPGMGMISDDRLYSLLQMHFHTPAEHVMHGQRYPLVAHLVHGTPDGQFAVLGVMFKEGDANPALQAIVDAIGQDEEALELDVSTMLPDDISVYRYMGSLTTPPCTEGVNWHVADTVVTASGAQIAAMSERLGVSNRSLQPVNNRLVVAPAN